MSDVIEREQGQLDVLDEAPQQRTRPEHDVRKSWSGVLNPEFLGIRVETIGEVSSETLERIDVARLGEVLFQDRKFNGGEGSHQSHDGVVFSDAEHGTLTRSAELLANVVSARTRAAGRRNHVPYDENYYKGERSAFYALEGKVHEVEFKVLWPLNNGIDVLEKLSKEARYHGFAHYSAKNMANLAREFMNGSEWADDFEVPYRDTFDDERMFKIKAGSPRNSGSMRNILQVVAVEEDWSAQEYEEARQALKSKFWTGDQRTRVEESSKYIELAYRYAKARRFVANKVMEKTARKRDEIKSRLPEDEVLKLRHEQSS